MKPLKLTMFGLGRMREKMSLILPGSSRGFF